jgi:hypothetical protein
MLFRSKGQAFLPDFMASVAIFGFILMVFMVSWNTIIDNQIQNQEDQELYSQGQRTVTQLINSDGRPENWNSSSVENLGLAEESHVLNATKVSELKQMSYSEQQALMKAVGGFQLLIEGDQVHEIGAEPEGDTVFTFTRYALLNQSGDLKRVEVKYSVW